MRKGNSNSYRGKQLSSFKSKPMSRWLIKETVFTNNLKKATGNRSKQTRGLGLTYSSSTRCLSNQNHPMMSKMKLKVHQTAKV